MENEGVDMGSNYLIEIEGSLYGYDRLDILKIDILTNKPKTYKLYKNTSSLCHKYSLLSVEEVKKLLG